MKDRSRAVKNGGVQAGIGTRALEHGAGSRQAIEEGVRFSAEALCLERMCKASVPFGMGASNVVRSKVGIKSMVNLNKICFSTLSRMMNLRSLNTSSPHKPALPHLICTLPTNCDTRPQSVDCWAPKLVCKPVELWRDGRLGRKEDLKYAAELLKLSPNKSRRQNLIIGPGCMEEEEEERWKPDWPKLQEVALGSCLEWFRYKLQSCNVDECNL